MGCHTTGERCVTFLAKGLPRWLKFPQASTLRKNKTKKNRQNKTKKEGCKLDVVSWGLLPTIIVTSILSFLLVTLLLLIDCPCNVINCVANEHSFIHMTIFVSIAVYLRFEFMLWDSSKSLTR